jgi:ATP-dependent helicase/nuclease subunit B
VTFLRQTLEELFNPDVPFRHNPEAVLYPNDPYREFLNQLEPESDEDV